MQVEIDAKMKLQAAMDAPGEIKKIIN